MPTQKPLIFGIRACTWVWFILLVLSLLTYLVGQRGLSGLEISLGVLFLALLKGYLVGAYFMGLGRVRGSWRWPVTIWLLLPGALIGTAFMLAG
ncbi:MAG: cytochrome C oxidase subunit IV family protein [Chromatiaceae bacterium]|nr:cytochrome C oxidase subunit IV family protein [Chromatiaceae bacterium]